MPRTFRVRAGRTVTLPQGLASGPGATNMRLPPEAVITLEDEDCNSFSRYVNGRLRAEDWDEIDPKDASPNAAKHIHVGSPYAVPTHAAHVTTGAPTAVGKKGA